jgi:hypothetical protein
MGANFAQVQLFNVVFGENLGDVQRGGIGALLTLHRRTPRIANAASHPLAPF